MADPAVKIVSFLNRTGNTMTRSHIELILGSLATIVTGAMCVYASVAFRSIYEGLYGSEETFELITKIALAAKLWCPILLGIALIVFARRVTQPPQTSTALASLIALNLLVTLVVGYGFLTPFQRTTFQMSTQPTPASKTP